MDDRTRTQKASEGHEQDPRRLRSAKTTPPQNQSDPGLLGLLMGGLLVVMFGGLVFAGLAVAVGTVAAIGLTVLGFAVLVWTLVPSEQAENEAKDPGLGCAKTTPPTEEAASCRSRLVPGVAAVAMVCAAAVWMPGCGETAANTAAFAALDTNRQQLDPMTLRGIDDARSSGDISPALAAQYRGLLDDQNTLIDALLGRETGPALVVDPDESE